MNIDSKELARLIVQAELLYDAHNPGANSWYWDPVEIHASGNGLVWYIWIWDGDSAVAKVVPKYNLTEEQITAILDMEEWQPI